MQRLIPLCLTLLALLPFTASATLPATWQATLKKLKVPESAISVYVQELGANQPLLAHQERVLRNPASVMKVVTTTAGLDLLGVDYRWKTEVYFDGNQQPDGTLDGNLILKGYGDPKITIERWQDFMQGLVQLGLTRITGDLLLDRSTFALSPHNPGEFDGEPLKPYNVGPDALLVNFKSVRLQLLPPDNPKSKRASVMIDPPLQGVRVTKLPTFVKRRCGDWWLAARPRFTERGTETLVRFDGRYSSRCGEQEKYASVLNIPTFVHGMFEYYFREAGGVFAGKVGETVVPAGQVPFATFYSLPLHAIVYDINKRSNNVMAQQLFLTLSSRQGSGAYSQTAARQVIAEWVKARQLDLPGLFVENGSGLSRDARISAKGLANLLFFAEKSPWFQEFFESLPIAGVDGTLKRRFSRSPSRNMAYLKSGYLSNVRSLAGYVDDIDGKRYIVVVLLNHRHAKGAGPIMERIINDITQGTVWPAMPAKRK